MESNLLPSLIDAYFSILALTTCDQPYSNVCLKTYSRSSELNHIQVSKHFFSSFPSKDVHERLSALHGASLIPLYTIKETNSTKLKGGIVGPYEVLKHGIGDWKSVYKLMWMVPAIFPDVYVLKNGYELDVYLGLSVESALHVAHSHDIGSTTFHGAQAGGLSTKLMSNGVHHTSEVRGFIQLECIIKVLFPSDNAEVAADLFGISLFVSSSVDILHQYLPVSFFIYEVRKF